MLRGYVYLVPLLERSCFDFPLKRSDIINVTIRKFVEQRYNFGLSQQRVVGFKMFLEPYNGLTDEIGLPSRWRLNVYNHR